MPTVPPRPKHNARAAILSSASRIFNEKGFHGTSIGDIQEDAGIQRGTLYFHFKSKEDLALAVLEDFFTEVARGLDSAFSAAASPGSLFLALASVRDQAVADGCRSGCLLGGFGQELSSTQESSRMRMRELFELLVSSVERFLPAKGERRDLARLIVSAFHGALIELRVYRDPAVFDRTMSSLRRLLEADGPLA
ncbi:MAG: TetR/AcrR family transcriptional regulator [Elusimicrobiota bacterium]